MAGERFQFGENWLHFLSVLNDRRIEQAEMSLKAMLGVEALAGKTFLDAGSGSGLFSLAARRLGARVHSFDYDPLSVACTRELKRRYFEESTDWAIEEGSVLDRDYLARLGQFDIVYSWGVLHHTGAMWQALENVALQVRPWGLWYIAIYNDQGWKSRYWKTMKRLYNLNRFLRMVVVIAHLPYPFLASVLYRTLKRTSLADRGMSPWHDYLDWLGGYPFEVARPEEIFEFLRDRGFTLSRLKTCGGRLGCNEFVFSRQV